MNRLSRPRLNFRLKSNGIKMWYWLVCIRNSFTKSFKVWKSFWVVKNRISVAEISSITRFRCLPIRQLVGETILSTHSSPKPELENMFHAPFLLISSRLSLTRLDWPKVLIFFTFFLIRSEQELTDSFSIRNSSSLAKKMLLTTMPEVLAQSNFWC